MSSSSGLTGLSQRNNELNMFEEYSKILECYVELMEIINTEYNSLTTLQTNVQRRMNSVITSMRWLPLTDPIDGNRTQRSRNTFPDRPSSPNRNNRQPNRNRGPRNLPQERVSNQPAVGRRPFSGFNSGGAPGLGNGFATLQMGMGAIGAQAPSPFTNLFQNVPVYPSTEQIEAAIRTTRFGDIENPINTSCPISMETFTPDQSVTMICHCGHIFNSVQLFSWFRSNVRCPVCRYDVREASYTNRDPSNSETLPPPPPPLTSPPLFPETQQASQRPLDANPTHTASIFSTGIHPTNTANIHFPTQPTTVDNNSRINIPMPPEMGGGSLTFAPMFAPGFDASNSGFAASTLQNIGTSFMEDVLSEFTNQMNARNSTTPRHSGNSGNSTQNNNRNDDDEELGGVD
tara:strand:- start:769 stop:1977 length:1209 start_codon:yes stop_codon:yes gene_type:complete